MVPCFPLLGLTPSGLFMGSISTLIYTSELILCSIICISTISSKIITQIKYSDFFNPGQWKRPLTDTFPDTVAARYDQPRSQDLFPGLGAGRAWPFPAPPRPQAREKVLGTRLRYDEVSWYRKNVRCSQDPVITIIWLNIKNKYKIFNTKIFDTAG